MNVSSIIQYVLLVLLVAITLLNIYALTVGKKKKQQATANYKQTLRDLELKAYDLMKEHKLSFDEKHGYINDSGSGILLTFDNEKQMAGITLSDEFYLFPFSDFVDCKQTYETLQNKKLSNISVEIETKDSIITLLFGLKAWRPNSYLGKFLLSDTQEFCTILKRQCEKIKSPSADR
jgi:hypothetical protein